MRDAIPASGSNVSTEKESHHVSHGHDQAANQAGCGPSDAVWQEQVQGAIPL